MTNMALARSLVLVCAVLFVGCSRTSNPGTQINQPSPLQKTADAGPLAITDEEGGVLISYRVAQSPELKPGEWPALIVFLGSASGPVLDERIVEAEEMRRGMTASSVISPQSSYFFYQIAMKDSSEPAGYRFDVYDTKAEEIKQGAVLKISVDRRQASSGSRAFSSGPSLEWDWLGSQARVSAALVGFKTRKGDFKFQRFLTSIVTGQFKTGM